MAFPRDVWAQESIAKANKKVAASGAFWILTSPRPTVQEVLAAHELARGLRKLGVTRQPKVAELRSAQPANQESVFTIVVTPDRFNHKEAYEIATEDSDRSGAAPRVKISAASPQSALYAVFDFLQSQGVFFGLDGEVYPLDPSLASFCQRGPHCMHSSYVSPPEWPTVSSADSSLARFQHP
jgi:hypothetical protein